MHCYYDLQCVLSVKYNLKGNVMFLQKTGILGKTQARAMTIFFSAATGKCV